MGIFVLESTENGGSGGKLRTKTLILSSENYFILDLVEGAVLVVCKLGFFICILREFFVPLHN